MVAFYKHNIADWMNGTEKLDHVTYRVYHVICQLIYLHEGPIANAEPGIAGHCRTSVAGYRRALDTLLALGKLTLTDGKLSNQRAAKELSSVDRNRVTAGWGGRRSAGVAKSRRNDGRSVADKPLENNDQATAPLFDANSLKDKTREDETRLFKNTDLSEESAPDGAGSSDSNGEPGRVLGNFDFVSDDGTVLILADEFEQLQAELPSIKNIRGIVRHACRSWLQTLAPGQRKDALLRWLRRKHDENGQRQATSRKREDADEQHRRGVSAAYAQLKKQDESRAVRERLAEEHRQRRAARENGPGGEFSSVETDWRH